MDAHPFKSCTWLDLYTKLYTHRYIQSVTLLIQFRYFDFVCSLKHTPNLPTNITPINIA